jgi:transcriptional regulator with GAF, ATPase, and Fis domain
MSGLKKEILDQLVKLNVELSKEVDFTKKIDLISDRLREIIKADRCTIFVHDKKSNTFWTTYADGISYIEMPDDKGIVSQVFKNKKTIIENQLGNNTNHHARVDESTGYVTKSLISSPILGFNNECIGVVQLLNKAYDQDFTKEDEEIINFVLNHFSAFIQMIVQEN